MFAVTGITGQVGGHVARQLIVKGQAVRAVVRNATKAAVWANQGCELAVADMADAAALQAAFEGCEGVFVLLPPVFDPLPDAADTRASIAALKLALLAAQPPRVVCLSTVGAEVDRPNLLNALGLMEAEMSRLPMPTAFLRAAWFLENAAFALQAARDTGLYTSHLQPLDRPIPMVATADIGAVAAELLLDPTWRTGHVVELEGPQPVSPNQIAATFAKLLGKPVRAVVLPRQKWESDFLAAGMKNPTPRMQMLDGFNEGWIKFQGERSRKGRTDLESVLRSLI